jgi:hypothetical protein
MEEYHYFVAHEFSRREKDDLRDAIKNAFKDTGLKPYYADLELRQSHILDKIKEMIFKTQFGIYDISNPNKPNVFLELGVAIAANIPYYLICKKDTEIPADLAGLDRIEYESYKHLTQILKKIVVKYEIERLKIKNIETYSDYDVINKSIKIYQAESIEMSHATGVEIDDIDANNKKAWYCDNSLPCPIHILYGPYKELPSSGDYSVFYRIKIDKNTDFNEVVHIDVISNSNPKLNSSKVLKGIHFKNYNEYYIFKVDFHYENEKDIEYRAIKLKKERQIWVDYVAVARKIN